MKLFDAIFHILEKEKILQLDDRTSIHLVNKPNPYFLHRVTQFSEEKSYLSRSILEEYFTHLILHNDSKKEALADFVYKIEDEFQNPFNIHRIMETATEATLLYIIQKDHPDLIKRIQRYQRQESLLFQTTLDLALERLQKDAQSIDHHVRIYAEINLQTDKHFRARIYLSGEKYVVEERSSFEYPESLTIFTDIVELRKYLLKKNYLALVDGRIVGDIAQYARSFLRDSNKNIHTIREYLES